MARIIWTEGSIADLEHIRRYVTAFRPEAARRLADRIAAAAASLSPTDGSMGERMIVFPYLLRYRMVGRDIAITTVRHSDRARIT